MVYGFRAAPQQSYVPARAPPAAPAPAPAAAMAQPQQPSMFSQMAATAGGVAVGSAVVRNLLLRNVNIVILTLTLKLIFFEDDRFLKSSPLFTVAISLDRTGLPPSNEEIVTCYRDVTMIQFFLFTSFDILHNKYIDCMFHYWHY